MSWVIISNLFVGFATLLVGGAAFWVFKYQQRAHKKDAANIVLLELERAQSELKDIKTYNEKWIANHGPAMDVDMFPGDEFLMPDASWSKYKYLFVRDFDHNSWDTISKFYELSEAYDAAIKYNVDGFRKNEEALRGAAASTGMRVLTKFIKANPNNKPGSTAESAEIAVAQEIQAMAIRSKFVNYRPVKPIQDAKTSLAIIDSYDLALIILKLKKIASVKI